METNQIVKKVFLKFSRERVWRALTDSNEFGSWFGMKLEGPFRAGETMRGVIVPTSVDPEVAEMQKPYTGKPVELLIDRIEAPNLFSFKWHPFAIEAGVDYSSEPMTLVTFHLQEEKGGVSLTITESGFENIPISRRNAAFKANDGGWAKQTELIAKYLAMHEK
jgi:uncharacterized protein YndB with AHSA1/START domain